MANVKAVMELVSTIDKLSLSFADESKVMDSKVMDMLK